MKFTVTIEETAHLTESELSKVCRVRGNVEAFATEFPAVRAWLREAFPNWFIHTGGNHVALHKSQDDARRVLIVTEE